jgi:uncharacterized protein (DUF4213/DUF364 family)
MEEPLTHLLRTEGFKLSLVKEHILGDKYVAIMLTNGNIGVCATLGVKVNDSLFKGERPDLTNTSHRIILNAWFNALCNYRINYRNEKDIFDRIDFSTYSRIVMVGYFESLYEKFRSNGLSPEVFDIQKKSELLSDIGSMAVSLRSADAVILTGTTIFNNTFMDVIHETGSHTSVFLLGPSNTLSPDMFMYRNIKVIFGSVFEKEDYELLKKIEEGHGTRGFIDHLKKVYITSEQRHDF